MVMPRRSQTNIHLTGNPPLTLTQGQWDDLMGESSLRLRGGSDPALAAFQPGGSGTSFYIYEFNTGNEMFFVTQIPHRWLVGTDLSPHVHWTPGARGTAESGNTVAWKLDYSIISINGTFASSSTIDLTDTCDGTNDKHQLSGGLDIDGSTLGISSVIVGRLYRDSGDTWATNTATNRPKLLQFDIHYQIDSFGSDAMTSKSF